QQLAGTRVQASAQRYGYEKQLEGQKYSADRELQSTRVQAGAQRYGYDRGLEGQKYSADRELQGTRVQAAAQRYGYDTQLTGQREGYASQERQIGLQGAEDRKTLTQGTDETLRLRADARGAIRQAGRRFYG
ncbi:MAG: hypothetical protein ACO4B5_10160, partial [Steroidobacteraceae bacterium]